MSVVDAGGARTGVASGFAVIGHLVWTSDEELQFSAMERALGGNESVYAVRIGEEKRRVASAPGPASILDVASSGRALFHNYELSTTTVARRPGTPGDLDLSERKHSFIADISADGRTIVGTWQGVAVVNDAVFLQRTDATPPVRLGDGDAMSLSPDQKWVLARLSRPEGERLAMVPTGAGESRELPAGELKQYSAGKWFPDGKRVIFMGAKADSVFRLYVQDVGGGNPQAFGPDGFTLPMLGASVSPDGKRIVALGPEDEPVLFSTQGGEPTPIPRLLSGDVPIGWSSDSNALLYYEAEEPAARLRRLDLKTGEARVVSELIATRPTGMVGHYRILVTPDESTYVFSFTSARSNLVLAEVPQR